MSTRKFVLNLLYYFYIRLYFLASFNSIVFGIKIKYLKKYKIDLVHSAKYCNDKL